MQAILTTEAAYEVLQGVGYRGLPDKVTLNEKLVILR